VVKAQLASFLDAYAQKPWQPGTVDCCLFLADWAMWLGHDDPATHLRGTYADDAGFESIISAAGGVAPVVAACAARIAGRLVDRPHIGSIGVIGSPSISSRQWGAIFDGGRWIVRFRNSVGQLAARPLAIWDI
jgi:hypothetical protein